MPTFAQKFLRGNSWEFRKRLQTWVIFARVRFMEIRDLARDIHRKRSFSNPGSDITQAVADALIHDTYKVDLTMGSFSDPHMSLCLFDTNEQSVTAVASEQDFFEVSELLVKSRDIIVFAQGKGLETCEILGWLPTEIILDSQRSADKFSFLVKGKFLFEMPDTFTFVAPNLEVMRVWDHNEQAWQTESGLQIHDRTAEEQIKDIDFQLSS